ncbi:Tyrosine aminotransferase [Quillaja saponaria]|uniref:Tyrosine aminotransferase n=1 Tax=Quillaja saponaria TaxID=32244 RepID=A0AAD7L040_QUISA|nr:Tyrosine aminotransferase [Quillaja saponaria]
MENVLAEWRFRGNKELNIASSLNIRGILVKIMENLKKDDEKSTVPLGHGDPSAFPCFQTTTIAEDAIVDAVRSAKYNGYSPTVGILPARRAIAEYLSRDVDYKILPEDVHLTVGCQ